MALNILDENWISSRTLSKILMLTSERVRQLEEEGYFTSKTEKNKKLFDAIPSIQAYIEYLKHRIGNAGSLLANSANDEVRKLRAEADLKEAKAAIEQLKKAEFEATMHRSEDVEKITSDLVMAVRAELLALPGTLAMDVAHAKTPAEAAGLIKAAVNDILNSLIAYDYNPDKYKKLVREREKWMNESENETETEEDK
ncbi:MAG: protoporphyrinogen oxidase [Butyrivibrio sp.]|nr:protoporphyrinogen oxidase [Butyrivibrio sp.]